MSPLAADTNLMTWELTWARPLLLIHALTGFGALAISVHVLWFAWRGSGTNAAWRVRARRYAGITWPMYLAALISGALTYPAYMVDVRAPWLEANRPDMVGWFEIKEHWGAFGLLLAWGIWRYFRRSEMDEVLAPDRTFWRGQVAVTLLLVICGLVNVIIGSWVVMVRSV